MQNSSMRFQGKVVLITGGNRGIGYSTAKLFAAEGANVAIAARDQQKGEEAAREIQALFTPLDVRAMSDCERAVADTVRAFGRLDILVNGAGIIYRGRRVEETTEEEWDNTFDTNVKGIFLMSKFALPYLRQTQGNIVNISSYVGLVGFARTAAYAASKAAVVNLTRSMALDHAREGIRVNCVCPGSVETDMIFEAWKGYGDVEEAKKLWAEKHPLGRIAKPEEVARTILFLASEDASFITGTALPVDGGITAG
jgi:NAD(P)-dependent dehydrogenase (short-subunit alcohol dehydrogenase family)